jgi:hypothetical protein
VHVPHRGTLCRGPALLRSQSSCGWLPRAVPARVAEGVFEALGVRSTVFGTFLPRTCLSVASPAVSASFR